MELEKLSKEEILSTINTRLKEAGKGPIPDCFAKRFLDWNGSLTFFAYAYISPADVLFLNKYVPEFVSDELFDEARKVAPWAAILYGKRLNDQQFDECQRDAPRWALQYATERLSDKQIDECRKKAPWAAITYAIHRLSPTQIAECEAELNKTLY